MSHRIATISPGHLSETSQWRPRLDLPSTSGIETRGSWGQPCCWRVWTINLTGVVLELMVDDTWMGPLKFIDDYVDDIYIFSVTCSAAQLASITGIS